MNKVILKYLLQNFLKNFLVFVAIFYCFGILLNLFEEVEFFKNIEKNRTSRAGDFVINDAIMALSEWNELFAKEKYKWFVISGTFLGLIREGGFLKHDYDIDLGIHSKDFLLNNILEKINKTKNFVIKKIDFLKEGVFER